jgi:hypothetical protein
MPCHAMQCILYKIYFFGRFFLCTANWYENDKHPYVDKIFILVRCGCYKIGAEAALLCVSYDFGQSKATQAVSHLLKVLLATF